MRNLRLAYIHPGTQVLLAAILLQMGYRAPIPHGSELYVPTARLICQGMNAPALLFRFLDPTRWGERFDVLPRWIVGFDTSDLFFLAGVVVVWFFVGCAVDRRGLGTPLSRWPLPVHTGLLTLGALFGVGGLQEIMQRHYNNPNYIWGAWLTLVWSAGLVLVSIMGLIRRYANAKQHDSNVVRR